MYLLSKLCKSNIWVLPLTIYTQQTFDHTKTVSPPHLQIDFLVDSGATLNVLNIKISEMRLKNLTKYS